jgi:hypothetical protein
MCSLPRRASLPLLSLSLSFVRVYTLCFMMFFFPLFFFLNLPVVFLSLFLNDPMFMLYFLFTWLLPACLPEPVCIILSLYFR